MDYKQQKCASIIFLMFVTFHYSGLHNFDLYCTLIIETWLKSSMHFDCKYL